MARHVVRGGRFVRVADPDWSNPLDPTYAAHRGGRWNPPHSFGVLYLNADLPTARANVARRFRGLPYGPEDIDPARGPDLVEIDLPAERYVDAITPAGLRALDLPASYPSDEDGRLVEQEVCQPIGRRAFDAGELGIAARSAAARRGQELAWFARPSRRRPELVARRPFVMWFWPDRS